MSPKLQAALLAQVWKLRRMLGVYLSATGDLFPPEERDKNWTDWEVIRLFSEVDSFYSFASAIVEFT